MFYLFGNLLFSVHFILKARALNARLTSEILFFEIDLLIWQMEHSKMYQGELLKQSLLHY